jgi:hypothetical protein
MSVNKFSRQKLKTIDNRRNYKIVNYELVPYWDEGWNWYPNPNKLVRKWKKKKLLSYQVRMYRTWKHNRKHQWK